MRDRADKCRVRRFSAYYRAAKYDPSRTRSPTGDYYSSSLGDNDRAICHTRAHGCQMCPLFQKTVLFVPAKLSLSFNSDWLLVRTNYVEQRSVTKRINRWLAGRG